MPALLRKLLVFLAAAAGSLVLAEAALWALGLPRFPAGRRNEFTAGLDFEPAQCLPGYPLHRLRPGSRYLNVFESDPRGYFGPECTVVIAANERGFRGPACAGDAAPGTARIVFLGDSFTLGEGVKDEDIYPERTAALLAARLGPGGPRVEACNLGMLAFNTTQEWIVLEEEGFGCGPDLVVLGYFLNDAAEPYFVIDWRTRSVRQETGGLAGLALRRPPPSPLYRSRLARIAWRLFDARERARLTVAYYDELYSDQNPAWSRNRQSLQAIVRSCAQRGIPLVVLCFPVLADFAGGYPFDPVHAEVARAVAEVAGPSTRFVDLRPHFQGHRTADLWVHPTDHHPNELAHQIAAEVLAETIAGDPLLRPRPR
ncbi:MAG: SGNH/GDSL hydrolase family protein [Planctomycetota bacterium]